MGARYPFWLALTLAFLLGLACVPAQAEKLCPGIDYDFTVTTTGDTLAWSCAPGPRGTGTWPTLRLSTDGGVAWWYCSDGFTWRRQWAAATTAKLFDGTVLDGVQLALRSSDPLTALNEFTKANADLAISSPTLTALWCPHWPAIVANTPPPVRYVVKPNGTYLTRPTYPFVDGVRGTTSNGKVSILTDLKPTPCDCTSRSVEGSSTYCGVAAASLALCVVAP